MNTAVRAAEPFTLRRARPLLGTLVEVGVGVRVGVNVGTGNAAIAAEGAIEAAFAAVRRVHTALTRFDADSDIGRFNAASAGAVLDVGPDARAVLRASAQLQAWSAGAFDITLGSGPTDWHLRGARLEKRSAAVRIDLGGIAKGHAVDAAVQALQAAGCAAGWVNAGGDLRCFGSSGLTLQLRDEMGGGVRPWGRLQDGACATSHYAPGSRSALVQSGRAARRLVHLSVLAPCCLWADALTKVAAQYLPDPADRLDRPGWQHPALRALRAVAVWH